MGRSSTPPLTDEAMSSAARADAQAKGPVARMLLPPRPRAVRPLGSRAARPAVAPPAVAPPVSAKPVAELAPQTPTKPGVVAAPPSALAADDDGSERPSVAADAETVLPPRARLVPPPLPADEGVLAVAEVGDTLDADDDLEEDDDETPTGTDLGLPKSMFSRHSYGPVVDLSRPTVTDLDQPPPLPMALVPKQPLALARRAPIVLQADASDSVLTRQLARRAPSMPSMPLALMKPHVRIAKGIARDVRASKREIVIGLSIGLTLAAPLFIAGHLYLQRSARTAATPQSTLTAAHVAPARARAAQPVVERVHTPPAPERIQRAVAGLEPAPLPRLSGTLERSVSELVSPELVSPELLAPQQPSASERLPARSASVLSPARTLAATAPAAKPRRRPKPAAPPLAPRPAASAISVQSAADADEPELSPAERAGLSTTIPF